MSYLHFIESECDVRKMHVSEKKNFFGVLTNYIEKKNITFKTKHKCCFLMYRSHVIPINEINFIYRNSFVCLPHFHVISHK